MYMCINSHKTQNYSEHRRLLTAGLSIPGVKVGVRGGITGGGGASFFAGGAGMVRDGGWPSKSGDFSAYAGV